MWDGGHRQASILPNKKVMWLRFKIYYFDHPFGVHCLFLPQGTDGEKPSATGRA